jgi:hypothetical protein
MYNVAFDALYWSLGGVMLVAFLATIARSVADLRARRGSRSVASATLLVAIGALLALVAGFSLNALRPITGDLVYQQVHFIAFYVAFGLVLWGFDRVGMTGDPASTAGRVLRGTVWGAFGLGTAIAIAALLDPAGYRIVSSGDVRYVQEPLFFLPLFVALGVGVAWLPGWLSVHARGSARPWLAALSGFMLLGMLREATIVPSTDQPIVDLLLAFGPFTVAALCLYRAASATSERSMLGHDSAAALTRTRP